MFSRVAKPAGVFIAGVILDRASTGIDKKHPNTAPPAGTENHTPSAAPPLPSQRPPARAGTGNERISRWAEEQRPAPDSSMITDGLQAAKDARISTMKKTINVAQHPAQATAQLQETLKDLGNDAKIAFGAVKVISGNAPLTHEDAAEIAKAGAKEAAEHVVEHIKNFDPVAVAKAVKKGADTTYAVSTTTHEGVQQAVDAIHDKTQHEIGGAVVGMAASQTLAMALGAFPHPAVKVAGIAVGILGNVNAGAQVSEIMRNVGGTDEERNGAMRQKVNEILSKKAGE
ncbi:hypothetical protein AAKU55_004990 [Oxalobacteraceae bacterium GrIS 1.11]